MAILPAMSAVSSFRGLPTSAASTVFSRFGTHDTAPTTTRALSMVPFEDLIADEDVAITVTNSGYIKRTPITTYQRQGRGGKGRFGA